MENKKEKTTPDVSVGADTEQPISKKTTSSISENSGNIKSFEESLVITHEIIFKFSLFKILYFFMYFNSV